MIFKNNNELSFYMAQGNKVKFVFFWGHQSGGSQANKTCLSQWYEAPFEVKGIQYLTAEHYMMHAKALLFNDKLAAQRVLLAKTAGEAKSIGREINYFDEQVWQDQRFDIVVEGNLAKFSSNAELCKFLLSTGDRVLVEASPVDRIWGVGLAQDCAFIREPSKWKGQNLLGYALMEVRKRLAK